MTIVFLTFGAIMRFKIVIYLTNPNFIRFLLITEDLIWMKFLAKL